MDEVVLESKLCKRCGTTKPRSLFSNDSHRKDLKHPWCKECKKAYDQALLQKPEYAARRKNRSGTRSKEWYQANRELVLNRTGSYQKTPVGREVRWKSKLKSKYGMTPSDYEKLFMEQGQVCAICGIDFKSRNETRVDHCHATGKIRGILCNSCNMGLGHVRDRIDVLRAAILYLEKHQ